MGRTLQLFGNRSSRGSCHLFCKCWASAFWGICCDWASGTGCWKISSRSSFWKGLATQWHGLLRSPLLEIWHLSSCRRSWWDSAFSNSRFWWDSIWCWRSGRLRWGSCCRGWESTEFGWRTCFYRMVTVRQRLCCYCPDSDTWDSLRCDFCRSSVPRSRWLVCTLHCRCCCERGLASKGWCLLKSWWKLRCALRSVHFG